MYKTERNSYYNAKNRCTNPNHKSYPDYGGRGIKFLFSSFAEFIAEVGSKPTSEHTLNRINNSGNYEKGNVQWATPVQQNNNTRPRRVPRKLPIDPIRLKAAIDTVRAKHGYEGVYQGNVRLTDYGDRKEAIIS